MRATVNKGLIFGFHIRFKGSTLSWQPVMRQSKEINNFFGYVEEWEPKNKSLQEKER